MKVLSDWLFSKATETNVGSQFVWFKNPPILKSVHSVEHIHVMLYDPDPDFIRRITDGDVPRSQLLKGSKGRPG